MRRDKLKVIKFIKTRSNIAYILDLPFQMGQYSQKLLKIGSRSAITNIVEETTKMVSETLISYCTTISSYTTTFEANITAASLTSVRPITNYPSN